MQSRNTLPLPVGWPVMNEWRPLSDWQRCTSASWPRSANVNRRAPIRREIGSRDTQSCTVIHFVPRCVPPCCSRSAGPSHCAPSRSSRCRTRRSRDSDPRPRNTPRRRSSADPCCRIPSSASSDRTRTWRAGSRRRPRRCVRGRRTSITSPPPHRRSMAQVIGASIVIVSPCTSVTTRSHSTLNGRQRLAGVLPFMPTASIHVLIADAPHDDRVARFEAARGRDLQGAGADWHVVVGDRLRRFVARRHARSAADATISAPCGPPPGPPGRRVRRRVVRCPCRSGSYRCRPCPLRGARRRSRGWSAAWRCGSNRP